MTSENARQAEFFLKDAGIDEASAYIADVLEGLAQRREILQLRLAAVEVLTLWQSAAGDAAVCTVRL